MKSPTAAGTRKPLAIVCGIGERLREALALLERPDDRGTPLGLAAHQPRQFVGLQPAEFLQFLKRLPHADQARAAAGRIEDHIGQLPAELLGQFQAHRLLAFEAVRLLQRGEVEPAPSFGRPGRSCRNR